MPDAHILSVTSTSTLRYNLTATVMKQSRMTDATAKSTPKQPPAYLATNQKREPKQKSFARLKSATRKLVSVSRPMVVRQMVTVHLPLGANGFFLRPLSASSTEKTSCV